MRGNRRLAAIMFTDIVGYTALMQENEKKAATIRSRHRTAIEGQHQIWHGEVIQYFGDGSLSLFESAVEAVQCAIAIQKELQEDPRVPLRIGIHVGDIVFEAEEIYGDGVNLASRVESLGVPGNILLSERVNQELHNQNDIYTQALGHFEFKNVKTPVEVYAICNSGIKVPTRSELKGKLAQQKKSIAVLPFVNMSSDPENEYFSDGISEEILNALVKVEGLQVIARTSSFAFKGRNEDVREIGRLLGAAHVLEGSVRKAGNRVRITAQLINSADGYHFFSETYDRDLEDIFAVQDEIAQKITNRLREHLSESKHQQSLVNASTDNMEAYTSYLKGKYHFNQWETEGMQKALEHFEKAIQLQPDFAEPYAFLAVCYMMMGYSLQISWTEANQKSNYYASKATALNPDLVEAYFAQANNKILFEWDWEGAEQLVKKIKTIAPGRADVIMPCAIFYAVTGRVEKAAAEFKRGLEIDPLSVYLNMYYGDVMAWLGKYEEAIQYFERALEITPNNRSVYELAGWSCLYKKDYVQAKIYFEKIEGELGYQFTRSANLGICFAMQGKEQEARECLTKVLAMDKEIKEISLANDLALLYTWLGDFDKAFEYLDYMVEHKLGDITFVKMDRKMDPLREDPRFAKIVEKIFGEYA